MLNVVALLVAVVWLVVLFLAMRIGAGCLARTSLSSSSCEFDKYDWIWQIRLHQIRLLQRTNTTTTMMGGSTFTSFIMAAVVVTVATTVAAVFKVTVIPDGPFWSCCGMSQEVLPGWIAPFGAWAPFAAATLLPQLHPHHTSHDICSWYGVTCQLASSDNIEACIIAIDLSNNNVQHTIPMELYQLPTLEGLNLHGNRYQVNSAALLLRHRQHWQPPVFSGHGSFWLHFETDDELAGFVNVPSLSTSSSAAAAASLSMSTTTSF